MRGALAIALAGCGFSNNAGPVDAADAMIDAMPDALNIDGAPGSARKKRITIPDAKVFGNLTDFPVWLVIDDPSGLGTRGTASGSDIYFTRTDGSPLEWERTAWDRSTGHLEAWVRMNLVDGAPNELDLRYGDPGPAHAPNAAMVFTGGFLAVWHMDDLLAGNTTVADARGVVMGAATNGPVPVANGKLGRAIDFDGSNDEVAFVNPIAGTVSSTISAWVKITQPASGFSSVLTVGNPSSMQSRWFHTNFMGLSNGFFGDDTLTNVNIHDDQFTLVHWVYDANANTSTMYRDATVVGTPHVVQNVVNTLGTGGHIGNAPLQWGPGGNTANPINGVMDEVRIANVARTLAWIRTEHANQSDAGTFFMLGPEQQAP